MKKYYEIGYGLFNNTKMSPQASPSPSFETENIKNRFPLSNDKLDLLQVVPINNFQRQSCSSKWLEGNREIFFEIDAYRLYLFIL